MSHALDNMPVLVWGSSGHAKVLRPIIFARNGRVVAVVDRDSTLASPLPDVARLHTHRDVLQWHAATNLAGLHFVLAIGGARGRGRLELADWLGKLGMLPMTLVHPTAFVAETAVLMPGCQILAMATVGEEARIGAPDDRQHECLSGS